MEIQVGNKTLEVTLLNKEGNQVKIDIDGKVYDVDVAMLEMALAPSSTMEIRTMPNSSERVGRSTTV